MECFQEALPYYLKIGMTFEQFWDGDVSAHKAFREAEKLRIKDMNTQAWLQGMYFYEALMDAAPAIKAFCKQRAHPYPKDPYDIDADERKRREEREAKKRYNRIKEKVEMFAKVFNEKQNTTPERKEEDIDNG